MRYTLKSNEGEKEGEHEVNIIKKKNENYKLQIVETWSQSEDALPWVIHEQTKAQFVQFDFGRSFVSRATHVSE